MEYSILTISRQYGSGGRLIGAALAERLCIPCYDKMLLTLAAQRSSMDDHFFTCAEESKIGDFAYPFSPVLPFDLPLNGKIYLAQCAAIEELAQKGPCILIGRCADDVLRNRDDVLKVFVFADLESRKKRAVTEYGDKPENITQKILAIDKRRAAYYRNYTQCEWGAAANYHLCIDSGRVGIAGAVAAIDAAFHR
ncbi:MAG: cytidylate kinase-like family protein [Clostridia bacterium]